MARAGENVPIPPGEPTLTDVDLNRFCVALLDWDGVHLEGSERVGNRMRVLLSSDDGHQEWCNTLAQCEAFRDKYAERV